METIKVDGRVIPVCRTVKELRDYLNTLDGSLSLITSDADLGGYDVIYHSFVNPEYIEDKKLVYIGHCEHETWRDRKKNEYFNTFFQREIIL